MCRVVFLLIAFFIAVATAGESYGFYGKGYGSPVVGYGYGTPKGYGGYGYAQAKAPHGYGVPGNNVISYGGYSKGYGTGHET
uniref:Cuticular protein n=1 Tax=Steinernema glaseri TaxID=37863 RepID=A0A1I8AR18_9BILA